MPIAVSQSRPPGQSLSTAQVGVSAWAFEKEARLIVMMIADRLTLRKVLIKFPPAC
jgi:hypothetical protein